MSRRALSLTLLSIFAVQMLGGFALATVCVEPCPDDAEDASCPPICALCTSCTHAQQAIARHAASATPLVVVECSRSDAPPVSPSPHTSDIFHVPLLG